MPQWSFEEVNTAIPSPAFSWPGPTLTVRALGIIDEFDVVQPPVDSEGPAFLEQNWKDPTTGFNTWQNFGVALAGPNIFSGPVAVSRLDNPGRMYVFAVGQLSKNGPVCLLYWNWAAGLLKGASYGWLPILSLPGSAGNVAPATPAAVAWGAGRVDVFAVSTQGTLLHWWLLENPWTPPSSPNSPINIGGFNGPETLASTDNSGSIDKVSGFPAAVSWTGARLDVFASTTSGNLLHWWFDQSNGNNTHFGVPEILGKGTSPCACSWAPSRLDVFANTPNGIGHWSYDGTVTPVQNFNVSNLPPTLGISTNCGAPAAVSWGPGRFDVFACNSQGQLLHWFAGAAGLHAPDMSLANIQPSGNTVVTNYPPACASGGPGNLEVMARTISGVLYHWTFK